jgi:hypothetical protein
MHRDGADHNMLTNPVVPIVPRKRGAQPGNKNRQRHGLRSQEWLTLRARLRAQIRQTFALLRPARLPGENGAEPEGNSGTRRAP